VAFNIGLNQNKKLRQNDIFLAFQIMAFLFNILYRQFIKNIKINLN